MDPYVYQYAVGGLVFLVGLAYAGRQGYVGLSGRGLRNLLILLVGLGVFAGVQGYLQYTPMQTAAESAYAGGYERKAVLGAPLDYAIMVGYFALILAVGTYFGRRQKTVKDFFFGGQRFSWWLIAFSMVATLIGSYSFVKYGQVAYTYGLSSSQTYLNDWFWMPLLVFGWLPLLYFSRVTSIPEYFERRFGPRVRMAATVILLTYLISYVGVNLYTMGVSLNILLGWNVWGAALIVASVSAVYVTAGGQTSVIMTDLLQGVMLLAVGLVILVLGIDYLGGFGMFWTHLPRSHRLAFPNFNTDPAFSGVGIFWQDAMANSVMFYFLNQGMIMRFLAAKSAREMRKAALFMPLVLMPLAAIVVASGGWVAKALVHAGALPPLEAKEAFYVAGEFLSRPGVFGLVIAALTAALMSTVDSLITAVSAIVVNDIYKPYLRPDAGERQLLRVARVSAVGVALIGVLLVPVLASFKSIYAAHGAMTAAVTPPLVVALLLAVFWRRYTRAAAFWTLLGGMAAIGLSFIWPEVIRPFAHGVPMGEAGDGIWGGLKQYKFMRACYGLSVSAAIGVGVTLITRPEPAERARGLVWGTVADALRHYKGSPGEEQRGKRALAALVVRDDIAPLEVASGLPTVALSAALAQAIDAGRGDLVYVSDARWWLGGLHSVHAVVGTVVSTAELEGSAVHVDRSTADQVSPRGGGRPVSVERLY